MPPLHLKVNVDGGARGNPGPAAVAAVASTPDGEIVAERSELIGEATNNVAEYRAMILGIQLAAELGADRVELIGDSQLIVRQIQGAYRVKDRDLKTLYSQAMAELEKLGEWTITDVRREQNERADELVNEALDGAP